MDRGHNPAHDWPRLVYQASCYELMALLPSGLAESEGVIMLAPSNRSIADRLTVMERIQRGCLPVANIIKRRTGVDEALHAYRELRDTPTDVSAIAFQWIGQH